MNVFLGMPNMTSPPIKAITKHLVNTTMNYITWR